MSAAAPEETPEPEPGRTLLEEGGVVAGTMARSAADAVFRPARRGTTAVRLDDRLAGVLRAAARDAAALPLRRERARAGAALAFAVELVVTRSGSGRAVRGDGFLTPGPGGRSPADEVAEAVVLSARSVPEEWRVRHLGYLLGETAVSPDLDVALVGRGLLLAGGLTGRQLVLLAAVGRRDRVPLPMAPLPDADSAAWTVWGAREDVADLQRRGLLDPPPAVPRPGGAALPRLRAADLRLTRRGVLVHRLLALDFVREDAVAAALGDLGLPRS